jgi:hypothetical protein
VIFGRGERAEYGGPDRPADLLADVDHRGRHSGLAGGDTAGGGVLRRAEDQSQSEPHDKQGRQHPTGVVGGRADAGEQGQPDRAEDASDRDKRPRPGAGHERPRDDRARYQQADHRQDPMPVMPTDR